MRDPRPVLVRLDQVISCYVVLGQVRLGYIRLSG